MTEANALIGADGRSYSSAEKGAIAGHRGTKIFVASTARLRFGPSRRGGYIRDRAFFADTATARKAGYRPCAVCMPDAYREWKDSADRTRRGERPG